MIFPLIPRPKSLPIAYITNDRFFKHGLQVPTYISSFIAYFYLLDKPILEWHGDFFLILWPATFSWWDLHFCSSHSLEQPSPILPSNPRNP